jgi:signal transduction histidine kinase
MQVSKASLLLPDGHFFTERESGGLRLPASQAAVRWVASAGETQSARQGRLSDLIRQGRADLQWVEILVPLMRGTELRGLWLLGKRDGGKRYSKADMDFLNEIGRQAAAVWETLRSAEQEHFAADELRILYQRVVIAQEVERGRVSRDLHDGVLQDLCAISRDLKALQAQSPDTSEPYRGLANRSDETVQALRAICNNLRPPLLQHDLAAAIKALVVQMGSRSRAPLQVEISCEDLHLADDVAIAIFRITQEALQNAIQHADASEIMVRLVGYPDRLRLTVTDDGKGFASGVEPGRFVALGHFGLAGMRERAAMIGGKLDIQTAIDYGTVIILEIPRRIPASGPE